MDSFVTGLIGITAVAVAWVGVQQAWGKAFAGFYSDPDVLAERTGCQDCGCTKICERGLREPAESPGGDET